MFAYSQRTGRSIATQVLVIGGGVGGTAAAIQSARMGVKTILIEPTIMLGGMLTALMEMINYPAVCGKNSDRPYINIMAEVN